MSTVISYISLALNCIITFVRSGE